MISSELLKLTNRELKNVLRENNIKNYSKLNKKDLVNKVKKILNIQQKGGKKYKLKNLNGGVGEVGLNPPPTVPSTGNYNHIPPPPPPQSTIISPPASAPPLDSNNNNQKNLQKQPQESNNNKLPSESATPLGPNNNQSQACVSKCSIL